MGVGICLGSCCGDPPCVQLRNCKTEEVITTRSDLHIYEVGDVLLRHDDEEGGCWAILAFGAECDEEPQEFTPVGDPFTGETACQDCREEICICCGESCAAKASGTWGFFILNEESSQGESCLEDIPLAFGGSGWAGSSTDCGPEIEFEIYCFEGQWLMDIDIGAIVNLTEVPVQGPGSWAIFWSDSQADYRGQFGCCPDIMEVPADSVGIAVNIPECPR